MSPTTAIARSVAAATMFGLLGRGLGSASAIPDPGPRQDGSTSARTGCSLERIGTQLVRCDNRTGAGASAPLSVPEQPAR